MTSQKSFLGLQKNGGCFFPSYHAQKQNLAESETKDFDLVTTIASTEGSKKRKKKKQSLLERKKVSFSFWSVFNKEDRGNPVRKFTKVTQGVCKWVCVVTLAGNSFVLIPYKY